MKIVVDSREQTPFVFEHEKYAGTVVEVGTLDTGDYSLAGLTDRVAVERKSLPDLVACLGRERERFERELQRAAALDAFAVVVEASWSDLAGGHKLYVPQKPKAKHKIAEVVGFIGMAALCKEYGRDWIEVAQIKRPTRKDQVLLLLAQGGKTQSALAVEAGVPRRYVSMVAKDCKDIITQKSLELGHSGEPRIGTSERLNACGVEYGESA